MKLTAIFLLAACLQVSAKGFSQTVSLSEKNSTLEKVLQKIKKQTGYTIWYEDELMQKSKPVNIQVKNAGIEEALTLLFTSQPLTYEIIGGKIIAVKEKEVTATVNAPVITLLPVTLTVNGRIVNEEGEPVQASVMVKGTANGTTSNAEGFFELKEVDEQAILVISGVSIETIEVRVSGRKNITVNAKTKIAAQEEVVVKTNYWETRQRQNPGNISKVTSKEIERQPVSNPLAALQANVPGLEIVQTTGVPGGGFKVRIRGTNSIANGNNPLYVIDGVPYTSTPMSFNETSGSILGSGSATYSEYGGSPLNNINPSDIESIEVLKDADATAIYGSRGASGVILITTKKGRAGKTKVGVNLYSGIGQVAKKMDLLNTKQYLAMRREAFANDNIVPSASNAPDLLLWDTTRYTDWQKELIGGTARYTDAQLSVSGGEEHTQFLIGGGYHKETTVYPGDNADRRISMHATINNASLNKRLKTMLSVSYSATATNLLSQDLTSRALTFAPNAPALYNPDGSLNWIGWSGSIENPIAYTKRVYEATTNNLVANLTLSYTLFNGLDIKTNLGYTSIKSNAVQTQPISSLGPDASQQNVSKFSNSNFQNWLVEPQLNWKKKINRGVLDVLLGTTILQQQSDGLAQYALGFSSESLMKNIAAASSISSSTNYYAQYRYNAVFGRVNYTYRDKYIVNLTGRRDGSSRFGPNKQFANFGAVGAAWIFSNEPFIQQSLHFLSFGKLRMSYGTSGNDQIGDYQYLDAYSLSNTYQTGVGLTPARLSNPDFSWETNRKFEAGIELGIMNDAVAMIVSYYRNRSSNQLVGFPLAPTTGFQEIQGNFPATVQNTGVEIEVNTRNIASKNFKWTTAFNLSIPRNKLVTFPNIATFPAYESMYVVGRPLSIQKGYHYLGVDPSTGFYLFEDVNNDGLFDTRDRQTAAFIGSTFFGGIQNNITYKGFQLSVLFQFVKQNRVNYTRIFSYTPGTMYNQPAFVTERWQHPGDNTGIQLFSTSGQAYELYYSQLYSSDNAVVDASFIRLKNISLSWSLPQGWLQKLRCDNAGVFVRAQNLFTITNYTGMDPENAGSSLPPLRVITGGIQLTF